MLRDAKGLNFPIFAELRDIVVEHGMDHDPLAMKWNDPARVMDRFVERVAARSANGSAFRTSSR